MNKIIEGYYDVDIDLTGGNMNDTYTTLDDSEIVDSSMVKNVQRGIQDIEFTYQFPSSLMKSINEEATVSLIKSKDCTDIATFSTVLLRMIINQRDPKFKRQSYWKWSRNLGLLRILNYKRPIWRLKTQFNNGWMKPK